MKAIKEIREERTDVISFWVEKEIQGINGVVTIEEKIEETTEIALLEKKLQHENDLQVVNEKLLLISEL